MYFSYDPNSLANLYPLDASDVREIIKMNRNGIKPESLKSDPEPYVPEFVTAVGDDSITRFDEARKKKKKKKPENRSGNDRRKGGGGKARGDRRKEDAPKKQSEKKAD
jgi:hypothetical protein